MDSSNEIHVIDSNQFIQQPEQSQPGQPEEQVNTQPLNVNDLNNLNTNLALGSRLLSLDGKSQEKVLGNTKGIDDEVIEVQWRNLVYKVERSALIDFVKKDGEKVKVILKGLTGYFRSGQLTAIMGPSGAGKSTLLECVSGKRKKGLSGDVRIIGSSKIDIGLIAQSDYLINQLTVKESLIFASKLKNYKKAELEESLEEVVVGDDYAENVPIVKQLGYHQALAMNVMKQLGLEICADTKCGNEFQLRWN